MSEWVIDASVAVKWLVAEPLSDKAIAALARPESRIAPNLIVAEVASVLWKKVRRSDLSAQLAHERLAALAEFEVALHPAESFIEAALAIALGTKRTVYDTLYVALAEARRCPLLTADEALVNGLKNERPAAEIIWLGSL